MKRITPRRAVALAAITAAATGALAAPAVAIQQPSTATTKAGPSTCFWAGPVTRLQNNFAYPDSGAAYWAARYTPPAGAQLTLKGSFPHARYLSLNAYRADASPSDVLTDTKIRPDAGATNPFGAGARRDAAKRGYTVRLLPQQPPADPAAREANTIYTGDAGSIQTLVMRIYVPDKGKDITGGVGLPAVSMRLADGSVLTGQALCDAVKSAGLPPVTTLNAATYSSLRNQPGKPVGFPALPTPRWDASYNQPYNLGCSYQGTCGGTPERRIGQYANLDNAYVSAYVSRQLGKVLVLRGKLPTTPKTWNGDARMGTGQLRYWSICQNESLATTVTPDCLFDEQLKVDRKGFFTIVTSRPEDRPANATVKCGVNYLPWPRRGDGAGHLDDGRLLLRNMLPEAGFAQAIQNTKAPGDEAKVMGAFFPKSTYTSKATFEKRGC